MKGGREGGREGLMDGWVDGEGEEEKKLFLLDRNECAHTH